MVTLDLCQSTCCRACRTSCHVAYTARYRVFEKVTSDLGSLFRGCGTGYEEEGDEKGSHG